MPKVTEEYVEARRRQITEAAFVCFARKGFHQTTMHDICAEAELSAGAVYCYFHSKQEIIEISCLEAQERNLLILAEAAAATDTQKLMQALAARFFPQLDRPGTPEANRAMVQVWGEATVSERIRVIRLGGLERARSCLSAFVRRAQARGEFNPSLDPDALARAMVSLYDGFLLQKALEPGADTSAYAEGVMALFMGMLWTKPGGSGRSDAPT